MERGDTGRSIETTGDAAAAGAPPAGTLSPGASLTRAAASVRDAAGDPAVPAAHGEAPSPATTRPSPAVTPPTPAAVAAMEAPAPRRRRRPVRSLLLAAGPIAALAIAGWLYLSGGAIVSTDDAYVKAGTLSISSEVAGKVASVAVHDNEPVKAGEVLFTIDPEPYQHTLDAAKANLALVHDEIASAIEAYHHDVSAIDQAKADVTFYKTQYDRTADLTERKVTAQSALDSARHDLDVAQSKLDMLERQAASTLAKLGGSADRPVESYAAYLQQAAAVATAERNLRVTTVRAPIDGIATNVSALQEGQYLEPGSAAFSLVSSEDVWVEANPKETDLTYLKSGDTATVTVDAFPDKPFIGHVETVSPATGAEFAVLPAQNASGNWVKVVQRVPVRIRLDPAAGGPTLRAGMSVNVDIDTGHRRTLGDLVPSAFAGN